jgi:hypothetical protein
MMYESTGSAWTALTVSGSSLVANSITAAQIAANTITAAQISSGYVYAGSISADQITTGTLNATNVAVTNLNASNITTGTLNAANVAVTNLNAGNITTGTLSASKVLFADGTALTTASRVSTIKLTGSTQANTSGYSAPGTAIPGLSASVPTASTADVFNVFGSLLGAQTTGPIGDWALINLYVDGVLNQSVKMLPQILSQAFNFSFVMSLTGLSAGTHTFTFYIQAVYSPTVYNSGAQSTVLIQRIY